jgi:hypothetical protein
MCDYSCQLTQQENHADSYADPRRGKGTREAGQISSGILGIYLLGHRGALSFEFALLKIRTITALAAKNHS